MTEQDLLAELTPLVDPVAMQYRDADAVAALLSRWLNQCGLPLDEGMDAANMAIVRAFGLDKKPH